MKRFRADLHIHTCLSPCAELEMNPREIVEAARGKGIDIIAITDHNSAENVEAVRGAALGKGVTVLGGMEVTSSEEVHLLALFAEREQLLRMQDIVYENLPSGENDERLYGRQVIVNEFNEVTGFNRRLLIAATALTTALLVEAISSLGGLAMASHIDRESFSVLSQLGFLPEGLRFDALEISPRIGREKAEERFGALGNSCLVSFSDAHRISDIGRRVTTFTMRGPTLGEIGQALGRLEGRDMTW